MSETKQTISEFNISDLNMSAINSAQKASLAKLYNGSSELMLEKLIDDNCILDVPTGKKDETVKVSILAVLLDNQNIKGKQKDKLISACADSDDQEVLFRLARDPKTPFEIQKKLTEHENGDIRVALVMDRNIPLISILKILAKDSNWAIRRECANSPYITSKISEIMLNDDDDDVISTLVLNEKTSDKIVNKVTDKFIDQDGWYDESGNKDNVAPNHKILKALVSRKFESELNIEEFEDDKLLNYIADQQEELYRLILVQHPDTPINLFQKLYREGDELTKTYMTSTDKSGEKLLLRFTQNKDTQALELINLSNSKFENVRISVAQHTNTIEMILKKLSFDESKKVRKTARDAISLREQEAKEQAVSADDLADR